MLQYVWRTKVEIDSDPFLGGVVNRDRGLIETMSTVYSYKCMDILITCFRQYAFT